MNYFALRDRNTKQLHSVHRDKDAAEGAIDEILASFGSAPSFPEGSAGASMGAFQPRPPTPDIEIVTVDELQVWNYLLTLGHATLKTDSWMNHLGS